MNLKVEESPKLSLIAKICMRRSRNTLTLVTDDLYSEESRGSFI